MLLVYPEYFSGKPFTAWIGVVARYSSYTCYLHRLVCVFWCWLIELPFFDNNWNWMFCSRVECLVWLYCDCFLEAMRASQLSLFNYTERVVNFTGVLFSWSALFQIITNTIKSCWMCIGQETQLSLTNRVFEKYRYLETGVRGSLKVIGNVTIRCSACDFLLMFSSNYGSIYRRFWDI